MTFQEAEQRFRELEAYWNTGQMDPRAYQTALGNLRVVDAYGETWMMQEHTGRWHVFRNGSWILMTPPAYAPAADRPQPAADRAQPAADRAQPAARYQEPAPRKKGGAAKLFLIIGLLGACLLCAGVGAAGYLVYNGTLALPEEIAGLLPELGKVSPASPGASEPQVQADVKTMESITAAPDGQPHTDSRGAGLVVPADAVEEGTQVDLVANDLDAPWRKEIETAVSVDTPFYSLSAQGKSDSSGSLTLSLPAASPNSRLLAVIDGDFLVELEQAPQDGKFSLQARAAPQDTSEMTLPPGSDASGSIYYAVITPKAGSSDLSGGPQLAAWHPSSLMQADERNCGADFSLIGGANLNVCRQNEAGTVYVTVPVKHKDLLPQVDQMVDKVEAAMNKYAELGFTTARLTHSSPMLVRVSTNATSPYYYPLNGVLYIPLDTVKTIAGESSTEVYHEMAHWIQAVKYSTKLAYWSEERTWWLETSAENMVMLLQPDYLGKNLTTYGTISTSGSALAFQASPYQWPGDFYVQAQLLKINLCDSANCPLSQASFAKAISEGAYPLMNGTAKGLISGNMKDYAYYLLGKYPVQANTAISLDGPVKSGEGYGEYVRITRNNNVDLKYDYNGADPQMRKETKDGLETLVIQANLSDDGVYPLTIYGGAGNNPGLPVQVVIDPGAPFYYTQDDGDFKYSDGSAEVKLLPLHGEMGIKKVRIVAVGENGGEVFKARVEPLSLEGAWAVMITGAKTGGGLTCSGGDEPNDDPDSSGQLMALLTYMLSGTGDMQADPTGRSLDYTPVASRIPAAFTEEGVTFQATALLAGDGVKYQAKLDIPRSGGGESSLPPAVPLAAAGILLPLAWFWRKRMDIRWVRVATNVLVIAFLVLVSTGCIDIYGDSMVDAKFTKIEYVGGEDTGVITVSNDAGAGEPQGKPMWKMTGSATYTVTLNFETSNTDDKGNETTQVATCTGPITFPVTAYIYKDMTINWPSGDE